MFNIASYVYLICALRSSMLVMAISIGLSTSSPVLSFTQYTAVSPASRLLFRSVGLESFKRDFI